MLVTRFPLPLKTQIDAHRGGRLIGESEAIRSLETDIACASRSDAKVLITGETGVGKDVVARLVHERSSRASAPLVCVNCAGIPDSLLESELFGHVRGSFTDAYRDKPGLLETASNGTIFLDEIGEMSARMQAVLLRFLETGELQRVGAARPHARADVRLLTATNRDLQTQISSGAFREDLYFRVNVIRIHIPPLRERVGDIPLLLGYYLELYGRHHRVTVPHLSAEAMALLLAHTWPGNVRELKNIAERIVLNAEGRASSTGGLPRDVLKDITIEPDTPSLAPAPDRRSFADEIASHMLDGGESFWSTVYAAFVAHDLTREDVRKIVRRGLDKSNGDYRTLVQLFNMLPEDYKRFLNFLRKHDCYLAAQRLRPEHSRARSTADLTGMAAERS
jgi:two-component system, NtrC family, response regulator AtoC